MVSIFFALFFKFTLVFAQDCSDKENCFELAKEFLSKGDQVRPIKLFSKGCEMGGAESCDLLGRVYIKFKNYDKAKSYFTRSCDLGLSLGCYDLVRHSKRLLLSDEDVDRFRLKACELKLEKACIKKQVPGT